ncbi:MAG TPA: hypothetical protein VLI05_01295 [Candidatus Saccharimonadia bacterium]|nr:hypothetical protein [Candidatus Saccharimonadia bacterium]
MTGNGSFKALLIASDTSGQADGLEPGEEELLNIFLSQGFQLVNPSRFLSELRSAKAAVGPRLFVCTVTAGAALALLASMGPEAAALQLLMAPSTPLNFNSRRLWERWAELQAADATETAVHGSTAESRALTTDLRQLPKPS